jgi:hypothetical protein
MKHTLCAIAAIAGLLLATNVSAQEKTDTDKKDKKHHDVLNISNKGITLIPVDSNEKPLDTLKAEDRHAFTSSVCMLDLGINKLIDNSDYTSPAVTSYLRVPAVQQNKSLFDMKPSKSININIYPWMIKFKALKTHGQRIYISSGIGLQFYNFRYEDPITYTRNPNGIIIDTVSFTKNKLAMDYLNIPLMLTFKTRLYKDKWLVYGAGITEGFRIASWTKQVSGERGKMKLHDGFGLADFNTCVSAEIGVEGVVRFYASYQVTSLFETGLDQHPVCFGLRFSGI